jgi:hypothetical protein
MTRIYISDHGCDKNDGLTQQTAIYSWKRARKLFTGHMEISLDSTMTRKRLMREIQRPHGDQLARRGRSRTFA